MEPAAIRYKNPGAMWGHVGKRASTSKTVATNAPIPLKWGSTQTVFLSDGLGQGNNIAVFNTWVDGICAQLDLWRSSAFYKNKRFADAINKWDGGNNTPSYIDYVKARVPGITEDTIMNDAFWKSPSGIAFLKAQSGHEAGKPIPAPAADWIEAQRRVFANEYTGKTAAVVVTEPTATVDEALEAVQNDLIGFGYHEIGTADGLIGAKTIGVVKMFCTDRGIASVEYPSDELINALDEAARDNWHRPVSTARAFATEKTLAPKLASIAPAQNAGIMQKITAWFTGPAAIVGAAVKFMPDANDQASPYLTMIQGWFPSTPAVIGLGVVAAIAIATAIQVSKSKQATVDGYQQGKIN